MASTHLSHLVRISGEKIVSGSKVVEEESLLGLDFNPISTSRIGLIRRVSLLNHQSLSPIAICQSRTRGISTIDLLGLKDSLQHSSNIAATLPSLLLCELQSTLICLDVVEDLTRSQQPFSF